ncbi:hypothetical protein [Brevibacterium samyangense]|uniref:hypothetical protein n=1 Tax=Brevibacterium samyangense TaxID=366888 RepID=UPI0031DEDD27
MPAFRSAFSTTLTPIQQFALRPREQTGADVCGGNGVARRNRNRLRNAGFGSRLNAGNRRDRAINRDLDEETDGNRGLDEVVEGNRGLDEAVDVHRDLDGGRPKRIEISTVSPCASNTLTPRAEIELLPRSRTGAVGHGGADGNRGLDEPGPIPSVSVRE